MTFYLSGAGLYCAFLLFCKFGDKECSKTDPASWLVVAIASAFWIVAIPISLVEISTKARPKEQIKTLNSTNLAKNQQYVETVIQTEEFEANAISQLNTSNS